MHRREVRELSRLARHCDWGVEGVRRHGAVRYRFRYFSSVAQLHDPCGGVPPAWWSAGIVDRRGASVRYKAYGNLNQNAVGEHCADVTSHSSELLGL